MITLQFEDFEEMTGFAQKLLGGVPATTAGPVPVAAPVPTVSAELPTAPAPITLPPAAAPMDLPPIQQPVPVAPAPVTPPPVVPTTVQTYTTDDLARAAMALMDSGHQDDLVGLLASFGVDALPSLPQAQYGAFATALRGMGAQI